MIGRHKMSQISSARVRIHRVSPVRIGTVGLTCLRHGRIFFKTATPGNIPFILVQLIEKRDSAMTLTIQPDRKPVIAFFIDMRTR